MNTLRHILLIGPLVLLFASCGEFLEPKIEYVRCCDIKDGSDGRKQIGFTVRVTNPNSFPIKVKGYGLDIMVDGEKVGRTESDETLTVPANDKLESPIYIEADAGALLKGGLKMGLSALTNKGRLEMGVKGWVKGSAKGLTKKLDVEQKIPVKLGGGKN